MIRLFWSRTRYWNPSSEKSSCLTYLCDAVLGRAWDNLYIGDLHVLMLNNICALNKAELYGNQISIIQSSGYGKSRMVHEQAKLVFTIPFNLRPALDDRGELFIDSISSCET